MLIDCQKIISLHSPAKINLFLAITHLRKDGYHNLLSLAAPLHFGDKIEISLTQECKNLLICSNPKVPLGKKNLIMKAIQAYRSAVPFQYGIKVLLHKKIPMSAGLGGGSSNGVATLLGLNRLNHNKIPKLQLNEMAAKLGSDCPLFLRRKPVVMRGRGEFIKVVDFPTKDLRVLLFKPFFPIETPIAYELIKKSKKNYLIKEKAEIYLKKVFHSLRQYPYNNTHICLYNNLEKVVTSKYPVIQLLLQSIRETFHLPCAMSGSGSACFLIYKQDKTPLVRIKNHIRDILGKKAFITETSFL